MVTQLAAAAGKNLRPSYFAGGKLAESYMMRRLFGRMLHKIAPLPSPAG